MYGIKPGSPQRVNLYMLGEVNVMELDQQTLERLYNEGESFVEKIEAVADNSLLVEPIYPKK